MDKLRALEKTRLFKNLGWVEYKIGFGSFEQVTSIGTGIDLRYYFDKRGDYNTDEIVKDLVDLFLPYN